MKLSDLETYHHAEQLDFDYKVFLIFQKDKRSWTCRTIEKFLPCFMNVELCVIDFDDGLMGLAFKYQTILQTFTKKKDKK
jgi:hypothetical protein